MQPRRVGKILLFTLSLEQGLTLHESLDTPGVLDQKWCPKKLNGQSVFGIVTATGQVMIYTLNSGKISLQLICTYSVTSSDTLLLSLDWSNGIFEYDEPHIICSDSKGSIHLLKFSNGTFTSLGNWTKHVNKNSMIFEVWIAGFYYWDPNIFFSGTNLYIRK